MSFKWEFMRMWPAWSLGLAILLITFNTRFRPLIRVQARAIKIFCGFVLFTAISRLICWKLFHQMTIIPVDIQAVKSIPWQAGLFVYWEDATFVLPFMIFRRLLVNKKYTRLIYYAMMFLMCLDFGAGHMYQNPWAALAMVFYIPVVMSLGEQFGVGTIMICHTIFDLSMIGTLMLATRGI